MENQFFFFYYLFSLPVLLIVEKRAFSKIEKKIYCETVFLSLLITKLVKSILEKKTKFKQRSWKNSYSLTKHFSKFIFAVKI